MLCPSASCGRAARQLTRLAVCCWVFGLLDQVALEVANSQVIDQLLLNPRSGGLGIWSLHKLGLSADGSQQLTWADVSRAARQCRCTALGYRRADGRMVLVPSASASLSADARVVVLDGSSSRGSRGGGTPAVWMQFYLMDAITLATSSCIGVETAVTPLSLPTATVPAQPVAHWDFLHLSPRSHFHRVRKASAGGLPNRRPLQIATPANQAGRKQPAR